MSTFIIVVLIVGGVIWGIYHYFKGEGSCGDCDCSCPVKDEMEK
ncbi:FeoB-associated Cys-rich membrane protein [Streptococcus porcinus]|uniref:Membrane protein n=1 Tax=Streptococcus porcinus TaxID=1340 RepID=A0A4V0H283_STRPO|nr:FeoB-associated Cys-rich membrane protein [Streptococcus porcinus]VTT41657.1 membrane protein [Streptococcus porcinus]VTT42722.1 membrane protein [Streptococcus porcinus]